MNKLFLRHIALAALLSLPVVGGCKPTEAPPTTPPSTNATPAVPPATKAAAVSPNGTDTTASTTAAELVQPEVPFAVDRPIPEHLSVSASLNEVIKLAQAGVGEEVMLTFVENATSGFHLGADEIIYLTDIGVPGPVINLMMERDKSLKAANAAAVSAIVTTPVATGTATQTVAAAPSYVQPPPQADVSTEPMEASVSQDQFDEALSPYGTWIDIEGYGRCWQPTVVVVNPAWRPYCDGGRWMYTDNGWYWYSDYSWGWAPFHYGRWFSHPRWGWCWAPDYTWGPAWVTWSYTDTYCGWAPLPPAAVYSGAGFTYYGDSVSVSFGFGLGYSCYSYVPWRYFCDYRPWRYCAPRPHCKEIYDRATCHNDYGRDRNRRVVNRGLPPERVASYSRSEVRRVSVREVPDSRSTTGRREEIARDGRTLEVRRPSPTRTVAVDGSRSVGSRNLSGTGTQPSAGIPSLRGDQRESSGNTPIVEHSPETSGRGAVSRGAVTSHRPIAESAPAASDHSSRVGQPLVVRGNGDGRPSTPSTWNPYEHERQQGRREEELASVTPSEVEANPTHQLNPPVSSWNQPVRPGGGAGQSSQVIKVGRGIEDRSGGPTYRVYSAPQQQTPSAPSYGPPATANNPAPSRPTHSQPSRSDDDNDSRQNHQPSRQPNYEAPRQSDRPTQNYNPPPARSTPDESRPSRVEPRSAPEQRSTPSRSESSRSESRPSQSDSSRTSRNR